MVVNLGGRNCTVVQLASKGTNINFLFQLKDANNYFTTFAIFCLLKTTFLGCYLPISYQLFRNLKSNFLYPRDLHEFKG